MTYINLFSHEQKSDRYYVFTEGYSALHRFTIGVIVGDDKVLVIDAGMGINAELRNYIESVIGTDKPIICAVTHGSVDHAVGAVLFDERYCNIRDEWMLMTQAFNVEKRRNNIVGFGLGNMDMIVYGIENLIEPEVIDFTWIEDGYVFDLGGVKIEVIALPGHSAGSLAYFDRENKICFVGDAVSIDIQVQAVDVWFNSPEHRALLPEFLGIGVNDPKLTYSECFRKYADVVRRFIDIVGDDVTLYSGHVILPQTINSAKLVVQACEEIADGKTEFDIPAESIFDYQKNSSAKYNRAHYAGNVCVEYDSVKFEIERSGFVPLKLSH